MKRYEIEFRNPANGDIRDWAFSPVGSRVAFFLLASVYLLWKGAVRTAVRLVLMLICVAATCWAAAWFLRLIPITYFLADLFVLENYRTGEVQPGLLFCAAEIALYVWFIVKLPRLLARDLFMSGYAPSGEEGWERLRAERVFGTRRLSSYREAYAGDGGLGTAKAAGRSAPAAKTSRRPAPASPRGPIEVLRAHGWVGGDDYSLRGDGGVKIPVGRVFDRSLAPVLDELGLDGASLCAEMEGAKSATMYDESDACVVWWSASASGLRAVRLYAPEDKPEGWVDRDDPGNPARRPAGASPKGGREA